MPDRKVDAVPSDKTKTDNIINNMERKMFFILRTQTADFYTTFDQQMQMYLMKLPISNAKNIVSNLLSDKVIYVGRNTTASKNGIYGGASLSNNKLVAIILELNNLNINPETGESTDIDSCVFVSYQQYIRAGVYTQFKLIRNDKKLHGLILNWLFYVYMRLIGSRNIFSDKQKDLLKLVINYFFYRFMLNYDHNRAVEFAYLKDNKKDLYKEFQSEFELFKKYKNGQDIFKAMKDVKILNGQVSTLIIDAIKKFQICGYYTITSSLDSVIGAMVITLYPIRYMNNLLVNEQLQKQVETIMIKYCKKMKIAPLNR